MIWHLKNKLRVIIFTAFAIIVIYTVWYIALDDHYVKIRIVDAHSWEYIMEPNVETIPGMTMVGGPGTGGTGPFLYSPVIPLPVVITGRAQGYDKKRSFFILIPGETYTIPLIKKDINN